jgi:hypothetical protein
MTPVFHKCRNCGGYIKHARLAEVADGPRGPYFITLCHDCFAEAEAPPGEPLELVDEAAIIAWTPPQPLPQVGWGTGGRLVGIGTLVGCTIAALLMFAVSRHTPDSSGVIQARAPANHGYIIPAGN